MNTSIGSEIEEKNHFKIESKKKKWRKKIKEKKRCWKRENFDPNMRIRAVCILTEQGFCMRGDLCPFDHGVDPVIVDDVPITSYPPPSGKGTV